jgi:hypothetical protein
VQIIIPPNSAETIRFEVNNHVTTRISLSDDPRDQLVRGLPTIGSSKGNRKVK